MTRVLVSLFIFVISSVGSSIEKQHQARDMPKKLVVAHGGFNSCKNHRNPNGELFADLFKSFQFKVVAGECSRLLSEGTLCHNQADWLKESIRETLSERFTLSWFVSCQAFDVHELHWVRSNSPDMQHTGTREEMWADLNLFAVDRGPANIIGHSYGGWTAMHSVLKISEDVQSLTTLDPISVPKCTPGAARNGSEECKKFPSDLSDELLHSVQEKTGIWSHYWQTLSNGEHFGTVALHSGPTRLKGVKELELPLNHQQIDTYQPIWEELKETTSKDF